MFVPALNDSANWSMINSAADGNGASPRAAGLVHEDDLYFQAREKLTKPFILKPG